MARQGVTDIEMYSKRLNDKELDDVERKRCLFVLCSSLIEKTYKGILCMLMILSTSLSMPAEPLLP